MTMTFTAKFLRELVIAVLMIGTIIAGSAIVQYAGCLQ